MTWSPHASATVTAVLLLGMAASPVSAQQPQSASLDSTLRARHVPVRGGGDLRIRAVRVPAGGVALDGRLNEEAWRNAIWLTEFVTKDPIEGGVPSESTEVAFIYDDGALYVGARMWTADPSIIRALVARRDEEIGASDMLIVSFDTYRDRRTAYSFAVDAAGGRKDWYHPTDHEYDWEMSYDPVWRAAAHRDSLGWYAEMRIPFDQMRFNDRDVQVWGVNVNRWIPARNEDIFWTYVPKSESGWSSWLGALEGIEGIAPSRRIELLPYIASASTITGDRDPANPFDDGFKESVRVGGDFKMGLGPNLTLDAAVNPDFGQVEADPAVVNLSAFEIFFSERRPFFIEGSQLLDGGGHNYFYSRRIGAPPPGRASGDYVARPDASTILGASKVTGRLQSGLSVGALAAVTEREHARVFDVQAQGETRTVVAPVTGYGIVSLQQEFGPAQSTSTGGFVLTGVRRDVTPGEPLSDLVARQAYTGGTDWNFRFAGGQYELRADVGFSYVEGDTAALARIQRSSVHYFQRPDQDHVTFDPTRTSLFGYTAQVGIEKTGGEHWLGETGVSVESPGFEINDMGRLGSADGIDGFSFLMYRENQPGPIFRRYSIGSVAFYGWNYGLTRQYTGASVFFNAQLPNFMRIGVDLDRNLSAQSHSRTRGGPLMGVGSSWGVSGNLNSNFASRNRWHVFGGYSRGETGDRSARVGGGVVLKPSGRWSLRINPSYNWQIDSRQYVAAQPSGTPATFGTRYIFAFVERSTLSAQIRINYAITPDLTIEAYAEPFAASGRFSDFGELTAAGEKTLRTYGTDNTTIVAQPDGSREITDATSGDVFVLSNRDFNIRSFRSNLVLRWEWRPGSTLFLVWQQDRFDFDPQGNRVTPGGLFDALSASGDHFFAVKLSYWIS